jgi:mono/diheme cytochrome c family protein
LAQSAARKAGVRIMKKKPWFKFLFLPLLLLSLSCPEGFAGAGIARPQTADRSAQPFAQGKKLFYARCGYCHLPGGTGTYMLGKRLGKDRALLETRTDLTAEYVRKITRVGMNTMPKHNRIELPDVELDLIAAYLSRAVSDRLDADGKTDRPISGGGDHE